LASILTISSGSFWDVNGEPLVGSEANGTPLTAEIIGQRFEWDVEIVDEFVCDGSTAKSTVTCDREFTLGDGETRIRIYASPTELGKIERNLTFLGPDTRVSMLMTVTGVRDPSARIDDGKDYTSSLGGLPTATPTPDPSIPTPTPAFIPPPIEGLAPIPRGTFYEFPAEIADLLAQLPVPDGLRLYVQREGCPSQFYPPTLSME
jgi:hypothetical protein